MTSLDGSFPPPLLPPALREGGEDLYGRRRQEHASTGLGAAAVRGISARVFGFWFRAPVRSFVRTRIDYMGYARAINPHVRAGEQWSWRFTSPALLASAVHQYGWSFIPNQVVPPLLANTLIGAVLYTGYLQTLSILHEPSARATKRTDPLPPPHLTFTAGFVAGSIQSLIAAPLDALQVRFQSREMLAGKYSNMWTYAFHKILEIGPRGVFAGWSLSLLRDSLGSAVFFSTFEIVKGQAFYAFVSKWYGKFGQLDDAQQEALRLQAREGKVSSPVIRPHYLLEPTFIALAGVAASIGQALIQYPIGRVLDVHYGRLAWIDAHPKPEPGSKGVLRTRAALGVYAAAYKKTAKQCLAIARREGGVKRWLYRGFLWRTLTQVPSTSAGLIVFEVIRRKYGDKSDVVRIQQDGYDVELV